MARHLIPRPPLLLAAMLALLVATGLAGCGQKGPLYLPGDEQAAERYGPRDDAPTSETRAPDPEAPAADDPAPHDDET